MFVLLFAVTALLGLALVSHAVVLVDFQVAQPPPVPTDALQCTVQILQRTFAFSFGSPEIVQYTPPTECGTPGSWAAVTLNMTVTSNGTQFDRLGIFTLHNVEIWRTSTPEPTRGDGIIWTYVKDVSRYIPLFAQPGTFILELNNLIQEGLDGQYATTVTATFYASSPSHLPAKQANTIIPLSTLSNTSASTASVPPPFSINVTIPQNAVQVYAELYASGNGAEEFWYYNAPNQFISYLPNDTTFGQGPFREVRLLVDGQLGGVVFPYATIFTGGITPSTWRPITSYGALDLPTYVIDLTPFVPVLTDGQPHNFVLDVVSAETDHNINNNWFVSGVLQVITDSSPERTTGMITLYDADPFSGTTTSGRVGPNGDIEILVEAKRHLSIEADITSGSGTRTHVVWTQDLAFSNTQVYLNNFTSQNVVQTSSGISRSTHDDKVVVFDQFSYPLSINVTVLNTKVTTFAAIFDQSYERSLLPNPLIVESTILEHQSASGTLILTPSRHFGTGGNNNTFAYVDKAGNTYSRQVAAAQNVILFDHEQGSLAPQSHSIRPLSLPLSSVPQPGVDAFSAVRLPGGRVLGELVNQVLDQQ